MTFPRGSELLVILFIVLLLFGARRLPDLARSLGQSVKELRRASSDDEVEGGDSGSGDQKDGSASDGTDERA
jgi:sec-independent protein translocase protein TatA